MMDESRGDVQPEPPTVIIDTDPGIDDAFALVYGFSSSAVKVHSITTVFGNVSVEKTSRNALFLAELCGSTVDVAKGASLPLCQEQRIPKDAVHGSEGMGDLPAPSVNGSVISTPAAEHLAHACAANPGKITIVTIGPMTNLAEALALDPRIAENAAGVVAMAGSLRAGGNATDAAEFNAWGDPKAADIVFGVPWVSCTMIGLDVTRKIGCSREDFDAIASTGKAGVYLHDAAEYYFRFHEAHRDQDNFVFMHDPAAVIATHAPDLFTYEDVPLRVVLDGEDIGKTVVAEDSGRRPVKVATGVNADAVRKIWMDGLGVKS